MHNELFESMALAVKEAVEGGMRAVFDRIEPRLKELEAKEYSIINNVTAEVPKEDIEKTVNEALSLFKVDAPEIDYEKIKSDAMEGVNNIILEAQKRHEEIMGAAYKEYFSEALEEFAKAFNE